MKRLLPFVLLALLAQAGNAAPPPIPTDGTAPPKAAAFKFPLAPAAPSPAPQPGEALKIAPDTVYVIPHDEPFLLFASSPTSPAPLVMITREAGPLKIRGQFVDSPPGKIETRTFPQKFLAIVEAAPNATGRVELIAVPGGTTDETDVVRQLIDVNRSAQPPPKDDKKIEPAPEPKPQPPQVEPEPKPEPKTTGPLWLVIVEENASVETAKLLADTAFLARMKAAGHKVHVYTASDPAAGRRGYVKAATQDTAKRTAPGLPALIVVDQDGDIVRAVPRPVTVAEVEALVKAVGQ